MSTLPAPEVFESADAEALQDYGARLATTLPRPARLLLIGDLGAGKTTFVQGLAAGLGVASREDVTSPTFTLIHEYHRGERSLYHIDLYRIDTARELATLGLDELLAPDAPAGAVVAVEWGEKIEAAVSRPYLRLGFEIPTPERRRVTAQWIVSDPGLDGQSADAPPPSQRGAEWQD